MHYGGESLERQENRFRDTRRHLRIGIRNELPQDRRTEISRYIGSKACETIKRPPIDDSVSQRYEFSGPGDRLLPCAWLLHRLRPLPRIHAKIL